MVKPAESGIFIEKIARGVTRLGTPKARKFIEHLWGEEGQDPEHYNYEIHIR